MCIPFGERKRVWRRDVCREKGKEERYWCIIYFMRRFTCTRVLATTTTTRRSEIRIGSCGFSASWHMHLFTFSLLLPSVASRELLFTRIIHFLRGRLNKRLNLRIEYGKLIYTLVHFCMIRICASWIWQDIFAETSIVSFSYNQYTRSCKDNKPII